LSRTLNFDLPNAPGFILAVNNDALREPHPISRRDMNFSCMAGGIAISG